MELDINAMLYRKIMIECDELAFQSVKINQEAAKIFQDIVNKNHRYDGELWSKRAQVLWDLFHGPYLSTLGFSQISNLDERHISMCRYLYAVFNSYQSIGHEMKKVTIESFVPSYIFILGLEQLSGIGIDGKSARIEAFKKIINESPEYKVFFILSSSTLEDCATLRTAVSHVLCDNLTTQMQGHLKIGDYYPDKTEPFLGIYYLATEEKNRCRKFKKMIYKGEVF